MKARRLFKILYLYNFLFFGYLFAGEISIVPIESSDLQAQFCLFKKCWHSAFKDCSLKQLGFSSLSEQIYENFKQDEQDYIKKASNRLFFNAIQDEEVVGYISFDIKDGQAIYIKNIAILPDLCTVDSLRELIFIIFDYINDVSCVHMTLHKKADIYRNLGAELGFVALPRANDLLYIHLRLQFNKCGTCLCDFDYEEMPRDQDSGLDADEIWQSFNDEDKDDRGCSKDDSGDDCSCF